MTWISSHLPLQQPVQVITLLLAVALIAPLISVRFKMPAIIGCILAGIVIGPNALNLISQSDTTVLLRTAGLLLIMLLAGLEIDLNRFNRYRSHGFIFGALTFLLPQCLGTWGAIQILGMSWEQGILLGSVFASHTLLPYPIISRLGLSRNMAVTTAVGGTIITDVLALLVLAVIASASQGELSFGFWLRMMLSLVVASVLVLWGIPRVGRWFFKHVRQQESSEFLFVATAAFGSAAIFELAGVEAIIGAFMGGLALNRFIPESSPLMARLKFMGDAILIPMALLSVGMLVDLRVFAGGWMSWKVCLYMCCMVTVTKWLAARIASWVLKYTYEESWIIFSLSINQAAATLAAVLVGYKLKLFDDAVLNGTILMMLVTCIMGPYFAEHFGRKVATQEGTTRLETDDVPQRILIPLSNPKTAEALVDLSLMLRRGDSTEPIYPITVARDGDDVEAQVAASEKLLGYAVVHAVAANAPVAPTTRVDLNVGAALNRALIELRITTVVVGWYGDASPESRSLGTVLDDVLAGSRQMVLACRLHQGFNTTQRVVLLLPHLAEREPGFAEAVHTVKLLCRGLSAELVTVAAEGMIDRVKPVIERYEAQVPSKSLVFPNWVSVLRDFARELQEDDMLVFLAARHGRLPWTPELDRVPRYLSETFPKRNLIVMYPPEALPGQEAESVAVAENRSLTDLTHRQVVLFPEEASIAQAVGALSRNLYPGNPRHYQEVFSALMRCAQQNALEIFPKVVFVHAHVEAVDEATLMVATAPGGIYLPGHAQPANVLLSLLSPADFPPSAHLNALASIARMIRSAQSVELMVNAKTSQEMVQVMADLASAAVPKPKPKPPKPAAPEQKPVTEPEGEPAPKPEQG